MVVKINTSGILGIEGRPVVCECDISRGKSVLHIVGLPDASVKESEERVSAAMKNRDALVTGLAAGIVGYAIGNHLGVLMAQLL